MVSFKLVIGEKSGKCLQKDLQEAEAKSFLGKKIGDNVDGGKIGFPGYEFQVTGGSDYCGFPMRKDVDGFARRRILAVEGTGLKKIANGLRIKKTVCGNTIHPKISQVNVRILKEGKEPLFQEGTEMTEEEQKQAAPEGEAPAEAAPEQAEAPAEESKEAPAEETSAEESKEASAEEETPAEESTESEAEEKTE